VRSLPRQQQINLPRLCEYDSTINTFPTPPQQIAATQLESLSVYCFAVLLASGIFLSCSIAGEATKMDRGIWRDEEFKVYVKVEKPQALADDTCLEGEQSVISFVVCTHHMITGGESTREH
jgi:hypothetical protein